MNKNDFNKKAYIIGLKNQLLTMNIEELNQIYVNKNNYKKFLDTSLELINNEEGYLFLDESIISNLQKMFNDIRFNYAKKEDISEINELIVDLNKIEYNSYDEKYEKLSNYIKEQLEIRKIYLYIDKETFQKIIIYDAIIFNFLNSYKNEMITSNYFCSSLNYLIYFMPELFEKELPRNNATSALSSLLDTLEDSKVLRKSLKKRIKNDLEETMTNLDNILLNDKVLTKRKGE